MFPDGELDDYLEAGWRAIVEEFELLRMRTRTMTVGLKGWRQDHVLKVLNKNGASQHEDKRGADTV